jgi:hypothetical protein
MTQDQIIEMAKKCGWDNPANNMMPLYEFAKLVASAEREACARVCETLRHQDYVKETYEWISATNNCADAIRARKQ